MSTIHLRGDARSLPLADRSVHCVVTSPPYYGLRDYRCDGQIGLEQTADLYLAEMRRVLRDDGTLWLNVGDSYAERGGGCYKMKDLMLMPHRLAMALSSDGWYVRDTIIWAKPNPMPSSVRDRTTTAHE